MLFEQRTTAVRHFKVAERVLISDGNIWYYEGHFSKRNFRKMSFCVMVKKELKLWFVTGEMKLSAIVR